METSITPSSGGSFKNFEIAEYTIIIILINLKTTLSEP
jgi:hypothetical protein